jgi:hypothetical protein
MTTDAANLIFGKYALIRRLALGGMGEVFLAQQVGGVAGTERLVILKSLLPELASQEGFIDQFLDEARVAAKLNHPNIVQMFEAGLWNGVYFIAMEFIRGENLARIARGAKARGVEIPLHVTVRIVRDALLGLAHAHDAHDELTGAPLGIVHRDVSPHNIMVRIDGVTKVVDFGIARATNRMSRTATGVLKGKIQYMAPEQVQGEDLDARTDQFAMGVVLWELCTGEKLFAGDNEIQVLNAVMKRTIAAPSTLIPAIPPELEAPLMRMLERAPDRRFATCADAADALTAWLNLGSRRVTEAEVAGWIKQVVGDQIDESTRNLTPGGNNFVLGLHGAQAGVVTSLPPTTQPTVLRRTEQRRRFATAVAGGSLAALVVVLTGVGAYASLDDAPPAATTTTTSPGASAAPPARAQPAPTTVTASPPVLQDGGVALAITAPVGARVFVDDVAVAEPVPTTLRDLGPGPHRIAVVTADGTRIEVPYAPPAPELSVQTTPAGAAVSIDGAPLGLTPLSSDRIPPGNHELVVRLDGHKPLKQIVQGLQAGERRVVQLALEPTKAMAPPRAGGATTTTTATAGATTTNSTTNTTAAECFGSLTLDTDPWSKVSIDGEPFGTTPLVVRRIKAGPHRVRFENEGAGIDVTRTVTAQCDVPVKLRLPLQ